MTISVSLLLILYYCYPPVTYNLPNEFSYDSHMRGLTGLAGWQDGPFFGGMVEFALFFGGIAVFELLARCDITY